MSSNEPSPDVSRICTQEIDKKFRQEFGNYYSGSGTAFTRKHRSQDRGCHDYESGAKAIESQEKISSLLRLLSNKENENQAMRRKLSDLIGRRSDEEDKSNRKDLHKNCLQENRALSQSIIEVKERLKMYSSAISNCVLWMECAKKQTEMMKAVLEDCGGWTEKNRYRIFFAYKELATIREPLLPTEDDVLKLAYTTAKDFKGIEDIETISEFKSRERVQNKLIQTDPLPEFIENHAKANTIESSSCDFRLLEKIDLIQNLEVENARQKDQIIILSQKVRQMVLLDARNSDLESQAEILRIQNQKLLMENETLKSVTNKKDQMPPDEQKTTNHASRQESRRIAQFFNDKYSQEILNLKHRLAKYEPAYNSETTRIMHLEGFNPLDEAHEEHLIKQAAIETDQKPTNKRRRLDPSLIADDSNIFLNATINNVETLKEYGQELQRQVQSLKSQLSDSNQYHEKAMKKQIDLTAQLTGYYIQIIDEDEESGQICQLESVLKKGSIFLFRKNESGALDLLDSDTIYQWKEIIDNYLLKYNSIPIFLSAITISIAEEGEEGHNSQKSEAIA